jgi:4-carboxymuconolactone decarboxylase
MIRDELFDTGLTVRREMFGPPGAEGTVDSTTDLTDKLQEIVTRWCFGDIWEREGLPRNVRSMITVAMLIALGKEIELGIHMRGALANGVTAEELREISLHALLYCGIPAAAEGIRTLDKVLADIDPDAALRAPAQRG